MWEDSAAAEIFANGTYIPNTLRTFFFPLCVMSTFTNYFRQSTTILFINTVNTDTSFDLLRMARVKTIYKLTEFIGCLTTVNYYIAACMLISLPAFLSVFWLPLTERPA